MIDLIQSAIDKNIEKKEREQKPREYLGTSYVGERCSRKVQWTYQNKPKDEGRNFTARVLRIFQRGHIMEDCVAEWFKGAGFLLKTEKADGGQFGFASGNGRFRGHADGVFVGWKGSETSPMEVPALWENKCLNSKNYKIVETKGIKIAKPTYYGQVQLYMYHLNLMDNPCVFTTLNADTMELCIELIPFDPEECQRLIDKAVNILQATDAGEVLPRIANDRNDFNCRFCDYQTQCWEGAA